jgi:hypothetical protein
MLELGLWKNIQELEMEISLPELEALLTAARDREYRKNKFAAALKGINLDEGNESVQDRFDKIKVRAEAKLSGKSEDALEFDALGLDVEIN